MYRATTPTITLNVPIDLTDARDVYVTFADSSVILTKSNADLDVTPNKVRVFLTQEETLSLPKGDVKVQINWIYEDGGATRRACSDIARINVKDNLINEVIE